jgi:putative redox protein
LSAQELSFVPFDRVLQYNRHVAKPPTIVDLKWIGDLRYEATSANAALTIDGASVAGPSPVQALGIAIAGCMTADVTHILTRGRHQVRALRAHLVADRAQEDPHRFVRMALHLAVEGDVPEDAVARAIALSREKYCSVWHSMRQDIDFQVTFDVLA